MIYHSKPHSKLTNIHSVHQNALKITKTKYRTRERYSRDENPTKWSLRLLLCAHKITFTMSNNQPRVRLDYTNSQAQSHISIKCNFIKSSQRLGPSQNMR